jgi:hypothetical protein
MIVTLLLLIGIFWLGFSIVAAFYAWDHDYPPVALFFAALFTGPFLVIGAVAIASRHKGAR